MTGGVARMPPIAPPAPRSGCPEGPRVGSLDRVIRAATDAKEASLFSAAVGKGGGRFAATTQRSDHRCGRGTRLSRSARSTAWPGTGVRPRIAAPGTGVPPRGRGLLPCRGADGRGSGLPA
jgi:hypothetical protein